MGIRHTKMRIEGVQFHPESIKTEEGMTMLKNFISWTSGEWDENEIQVCTSLPSQVLHHQVK